MKWKKSVKGLDLGTMRIHIRDHNGTTLWDFKPRGKNNIPDGILGFSRFLEEKLGLDLASLLVEMKANEEKMNRAMVTRTEQVDKKQ